MSKRVALVLIVILVLGLGVSGAAWYLRRDTGRVAYRTQPVKRTDIVSTIQATGTIVPEDVVDVGAQVNGPIATFGNDKSGKPVDYGSAVDEGMVLATIDDAIYAADAASARAMLQQAQAQVSLNQANLEQARAKLQQAQRDWERAQRLGPSAALSQADYDAAQSAYEQARAGVSVAEASVGQANAAVANAQASVQRAERNLQYCVIKSPVSGVIIDKRVEIGQTVVASFNAPSLFLLAKDLRRMQVLVQVNEADIGKVRPGQTVSFIVDAFDNRTFTGEVRKVRLNATMTQNVVTYTVEIVTDNSDNVLLPYLTANVRFVVAEHDNVLAVPNAALRWAPRGQNGGGGGGAPPASPPGNTQRTVMATVAGDQAGQRSGPAPFGSPSPSPHGQPAAAQPGGGGERPGGGATSDRAGGGQRNGGGGGRGPRGGAPKATATLWTLDDAGQLRPIEVRVGISDGAMTEVQGDDVSEGMQVVVGDVQPGAAAPQSGTVNPFAPQFPGRRGQSQGGQQQQQQQPQQRSQPR